jgi:hypothetical protein
MIAAAALSLSHRDATLLSAAMALGSALLTAVGPLHRRRGRPGLAREPGARADLAIHVGQALAQAFDGGLDVVTNPLDSTSREPVLFRGQYLDQLTASRYQSFQLDRSLIRYRPRLGAHVRKRPLGIPTVRDRVVQMAAKLLLEPIFEADFLPCSYGFRPKHARPKYQRLLSLVNDAPMRALPCEEHRNTSTVPSRRHLEWHTGNRLCHGMCQFASARRCRARHVVTRPCRDSRTARRLLRSWSAVGVGFNE